MKQTLPPVQLRSSTAPSGVTGLDPFPTQRLDQPDEIIPIDIRAGRIGEDLAERLTVGCVQNHT